eukprot:gb/GEZN01006327.1/.p1 GENE.gb/GEZN01006327.1/~~gb/GEZN01006327.1/.p1  ORF type:complete len:521 (+),score=62.42 gb/GEZN01006327.1/:103-1665(+)
MGAVATLLTAEMDWEGQRRADKIFQTLCTLSGIFGYIHGYKAGSFFIVSIYVLAGALLSAILILPPWKSYRSHPLPWQPCTCPEAASETAKTVPAASEAEKEKKEEGSSKPGSKKDKNKKPEEKKEKKEEKTENKHGFGGMSRGTLIVVFLALYFVWLKCPIDPLGWKPGHLVPLVSNHALSNATLLFKGQVSGPESFAFGPDGNIYTGDQNGRIMRFEPEKPKKTPRLVTFTGQPGRALPLPCGIHQTEPVCGRPLGMAFDQQYRLLVVDAYFGLLAVDVTRERSYKTLATRSNKKHIVYPNDLVVSKSNPNLIYVSDSSVYQRRDHFMDFFESRPHGRVLIHDTQAKRTKELITSLHFPNGLLLSENEDFLLVAESGRNRIRKIFLKGDKKNKESEIWADNLPGSPSKLSWANPEKTEVLVACTYTRDLISDFLFATPMARSLLLKVMSPAFLARFAINSNALVLRLRQDGTIKKHYMDPTGRLKTISAILPVGNFVYFGSQDKDFKYVARLPLKALN